MIERVKLLPVGKRGKQPFNWREARPDHPELTRAQRNVRWLETLCRVPEGKFVGKPLVMAPFMVEDFEAIYDNGGPVKGFHQLYLAHKAPPLQTRRAIFSRGRKNAKSVECAMIMLLHLCGPESKINGQIYSAAQSRDQAGLIFSLASKMVRQSADLLEMVMIRDTAKELLCPARGTFYKALSAEASTAYGLSPSLLIHDELGQVKGPRSELYEALETAVAAQEEPLSIIISTQAPNDADLLSILIDDALTGTDPRTVIKLFTVPLVDEPFTEQAVRQANPAFDYFMNKQEVMAMADDAKRMPAREAQFRNLVLNQRVETTNPFVTQAVWKACGGVVEDLHRVPIYAGLDLSSVADLTAFVMIGRLDRVWHVKPIFWLPEHGLKEKAQADRVPYDLWYKQGFLNTTPGNSVSYEYVAAYLRRIFDEYNIKKLGFDRWNMKHLKPWLLEAGFTEMMIEEKFVEFGQGTQSMSPALRDLEQAISERQLAHGNHPVLMMCAANAVVEGKDDANRKLSKNKSSGRIDGLVALAMAIGVAPLQPKKVDILSMIA